MGSLTVVSLRSLKGVHHSIVVFYYSAFATLCYIVWIVVEYLTLQDDQEGLKLFKYPVYPNWALLMGCGILYSGSMVCRTIAFQREKSALMSMLNYIQVVYSLIIDLTIFNVHFTYRQILGATIVLGFNLMAVCINLNKEKLQKQQEKKIVQFDV